MNHLEASNLLPRYVAAELESRRQRKLESHMADCADCSGWVATYFFLEAGISDAGGSEHLSAEEVATYSLRPASLDARERKRLGRHLERCFSCRKEIELVLDSLNRAEEAKSSEAVAGASRIIVSLAAALVLVLGVVLLARAPMWNSEDRHTHEQLVAGKVLTGSQTIRADRSIAVQSTQLRPGSTLRLESQVIAFGDGFTVDTGAVLVAGSGDDSSEDST